MQQGLVRRTGSCRNGCERRTPTKGQREVNVRSAGCAGNTHLDGVVVHGAHGHGGGGEGGGPVRHVPPGGRGFRMAGGQRREDRHTAVVGLGVRMVHVRWLDSPNAACATPMCSRGHRANMSTSTHAATAELLFPPDVRPAGHTVLLAVTHVHAHSTTARRYQQVSATPSPARSPRLPRVHVSLAHTVCAECASPNHQQNPHLRRAK